ncbi:MAG: YqjF family protein [Akkermansiaceae bacterium]
MKCPSLEDRIKATRRPADQSVVMRQSWGELLFLHWEVEPAEVQATLPPGLAVDTYDGKTYLGVVPFYMNGVRPPYCPAVPGVSNFLEMNVRAYVYDEYGRPGVWFYSLDANQMLAVRVARKFFNLPYFDAVMSATTSNGETHYRSMQIGSEEESVYRYSAGEMLGVSEPGSLEFFLVERYYLFSYNQKRKRLFSGRVSHEAYALHGVTVEEFSDYPVELAGFDRPDRLFEHAVMSHGVKVEVFGLKEV